MGLTKYDERALARAMVGLAKKGMTFYSNREVNLSPERRFALWTQALLLWNHYQGVLDGQSTN